MKGNTDRVAIIDAIEQASQEELIALAAIEKSIRKMTQTGDSGPKVTSRLRQRSADSTNKAEQPAPKPQNPYKQSLKGRRRRNVAPRINTTGTTERGVINSRRTSKVFDIDGDAENSPVTIKLKVEQEDTSRKAPERDSKGRYISQQKNDQLRDAAGRKSDGKTESGFMRKLAGMFGESSKGSGGGDNTAVDAVGLSAGGPLWMATKGLYDVGKAAHKNVVSMSDWMKDKEKEGGSESKRWFGGKQKPTVPVKDNVIQYPAAMATKVAAPTLGSAQAFGKSAEIKSAKAIEDQTSTLAANDEKIVDGLDDVQEEVRKLRKSLGKGLGFGFSRRMRLPGGRDRGRRNTTTGTPNGKGKPKSTSPGKKAPKKNVITKLLSSGKGKILGGIAAGAAAIGGGAFLTKRPKVPTPELSTVDKSAKQAVHAAEKTAEKTSVKAAEKGATSAASKTTEQAVKVATTKTTEAAAEKGAVTAAEKVGEKSLEKGAAKTGAKLAGKTALKAIPLVGTALGVGWDAVDGWSDDDGQRKAFNLADGQDVTTGQKATYSAASILDLGGIVSGGVGLLGSGLSAIGLESIGNKMQFDTADIASGLNSTIDIAKNGIGTLVDGVKSALTSDAKNEKEVIKAVQDGTGRTVSAINSLGEKLQGGTFGEDGVGAFGTKVSDFNTPSENHIGADLNIGGSNGKNRSFRNNNFGNLNYIGQEGATLEAKNSKGEARFARFNTPEEGMRALANQVSLYSTGRSKAAGYQKLETVSQIISKWAPPKENDTNGYIKAVSAKLGVKPTDKIDTSDQNVMTALIRAIATHEGGNPQVTDDYIRSAIGHYDAAAGKWVGGQFSDESLSKVNEERAKQGKAAVAKDSLYSTGDKVKLTGSAAATPVVPNAVSLASPVTDTASKEVSSKTPEQPKPTSPESGDQPQTFDAIVAAQSAALMTDLATINSPEELQALTEKAKKADSGLRQGLFGRFNHRQATKDLTKPGEVPIASPSSDGVSGISEDAQQKVDEAKSYLNKAGVHIGFRRPDAVLSSPGGQATPAGLQSAIGTPSQIAGRRDAATGADEIDLIGAQVESGGTQPATLTGREQGEDKGMFGSLVDSSIAGLKTVGANILPALGDRTANLIGGIQGTNVMNDLITRASGNNTNIVRAVSPLTQRAGEYLNGGIQAAADGTRSGLNAVNDSIFTPSSVVPSQEPIHSMPRQMPVVTDLAASGVRQPVTSDKRSLDQEMLKALEAMGKKLGDLLDVNKSASKNNEPDRVTSSAQPAPRERVSTSIDDPALDALLRD